MTNKHKIYVIYLQSLFEKNFKKPFFLAILLKSFKADPKEIFEWLMKCDLNKLSQSSLEQLEKFLPDDTTLAKYQELKENIDDLDSSEKFLVIVSFNKTCYFLIKNLFFLKI